MPHVIALLGRRDSPTDGVQDYCVSLGRALNRRGVEMTIARVDWLNEGWLGALWSLWQSSKAWCGPWVLLQYTGLAWSRRGFSFGAVAVLLILRLRGVRCGIVFHEPHRSRGGRWLDLIRGSCQTWVLRRIYGLASIAIFPDPLETIDWLPRRDSKATFIPIGANIPERVSATVNPRSDSGARTIAIFCITGAPHASVEIEEIAHAARSAVSTSLPLRFVFFGRGTPETSEQIKHSFRDIPVDVNLLGLLNPDEIGTVLSNSDVMLCVRGAISPRRGSAIAGISCGLPIVCYRGPETTFPITEAGLELVPYRDREELGKAVCRVLSDNQLRDELRKRSFEAHNKHFSWESIAGRFAMVLFHE
jgi:glycosyltransferase involved in cell wall biosynthesis